MKLTNIFTCLFILTILSISTDLFAGKTMFDDFTSQHLSGSKWWPREYSSDIENEKLVLKLGNSTEMGAEIRTGLFDNPLPFDNPETIHTIKCELTIVETVLDSPNSFSAARIAGYFYSASGSGGATGDVFFHVLVGDMGNGGLEANWSAYILTNDEGTTMDLLDSGIIIEAGSISYNTPMTIVLSYDNANTFNFSVDNTTGSFTGPERKRESVLSSKTINATILTENSLDKGFVHAEFDDVYINNSTSIYDDFSSAFIVGANWDRSEWVREASKSYLRTCIIGQGNTRSANTYLAEEKDTPYLEAKVRISSESQLSSGASGIARLQGYYYNDQRGPGSGQPYNNNEGDVFAKIRLIYFSDNTMAATAMVERCNDPGQTDFTSLYKVDFTTPIALDTDYILSIWYTGSQFLFKCNTEVLSYSIQTAIYPPYGLHRGLRTRVNLDSGESGFMEAQYDDIYIEKKVNYNPAIPLLLMSGE